MEEKWSPWQSWVRVLLYKTKTFNWKTKVKMKVKENKPENQMIPSVFMRKWSQVADMKADAACLCAKTIPCCHFLQWHFEETYNFLATVHDQYDKSAAQLPVLVAAEATNHGGDHKRTRFITSTGNITSANYPWAHMLPKQLLIRVVSTRRASTASKAAAKGERTHRVKDKGDVWYGKQMNRSFILSSWDTNLSCM